jgi:hypothetical protein
MTMGWTSICRMRPGGRETVISYYKEEEFQFATDSTEKKSCSHINLYNCYSIEINRTLLKISVHTSKI